MLTRTRSGHAARWVPLLLLSILAVSTAPAATSLPIGHASGHQVGNTSPAGFLGNGSWTLAGSAPFNRSGSAVAYDASADRVVLFGGLEGLTFEADTWSYDPRTATWTNVTRIGAPSARVYASMAYDPAAGGIVLFGGEWWTWDPSGGIFWGGVYADTWVWNGVTTSWTRLQPAQSPPARAVASMAYDSRVDRILLFGGYNGSAYFSDTWSFDFTNDTWVNLTGTPAPAGRLGAGITYDAGADRTILFGGSNASARLGDTWSFDAGSRTWAHQYPATSPSTGYLSGFVYDPVVGRDLLVGGAATNAQTWSYQADSDAWTPLFPPSSPPSCAGPSLVYVASASAPLLVDMRDGQPTQTWWYAQPLSAPSAPVGLHAAQGFGGVQLTWSAPVSNGGSAIAGYRIYRAGAPGTEVFLASVGNVTSYEDTGPPSSGTVYYLVSAVNAVGEGPFSSEASVTLGGLPSPVSLSIDLRIVVAFGILAIVIVSVVGFALIQNKPRPPPPL